MAARSAAQPYLTFREAEDRYATKAELSSAIETKMATSEIFHNRLESLSLRVDAVVPRSEHQLHWDRDAEKFKELNTKLDEIKIDVEQIKANRLPPWLVLMAIGIAGPTIGIVVSHFIH